MSKLILKKINLKISVSPGKNPNLVNIGNKNQESRVGMYPQLNFRICYSASILAQTQLKSGLKYSGYITCRQSVS